MAMRESAFLPTIKCSSCGVQVEISMMGEHVCGAPAAELSPPPEAEESFKSYNRPPSRQRTGSRVPSPVNISAANGPYMHQGQLTPNSFSDHSPLTPNGRPPSNRPGDYFSQHVASEDSLTPSPRPITRSGPYGGFNQQHSLGSHHYAPESPNTLGNHHILQRMDTIAPGPFDADQRPSTANSSFSAHRGSRDGQHHFLSEPPRDVQALERPGTAASHTSNGSTSNGAPPRMPRKNGYEGFGPPARTPDELEPQPLGFATRSETFPRSLAPMEPPLRTGSAPGTRPEHQRIPSVKNDIRRPSMGPDTSRPPPPRTSLVRPPPGKSNSVDLAAEFGANNPYHTPSDSGSSAVSTFSRRSETSSQTSPARSQVRRQPSDGSNIDDLMNDLQVSMDNMGPKDMRADPQPQAPRTMPPLAEAPRGLSPHGERLDPAIQSGRREVLSPRQEYNQPAPPSRDGTQSQDQSYFDPAIQSGQRSPSTPMAPPVRKGSRDPSLPSRGDCKGCGLAIKGKSISSADGRLTGKYHKACFVCTTCSEPFTSAEFYVLNDRPYCEQHYHKLNGSLCGSCNRGIEGQYLEDEAVVKYHVGCFRCLDCGRSLSDGYFDVEGRSYCERDAWRRVQQPWFAGKGGAPGADPYLHAPPRGPPGPRPPHGMGGLPGRPGQRPMGPGMGPGMGFPRPPYGVPNGNRLAPGMGPGMGPRPQMNKRNTRLGMMAPM